MPGRKQVSADLLCRGQQLVKLQVIVAETARNWRTAREIFIHKWAYDVSFEAFLMVDYVIRNPQLLGNLAGIVDVFDRAASPLHLLRHSLSTGQPSLIPELHGQADDWMAVSLQNRRYGGR